MPKKKLTDIALRLGLSIEEADALRAKLLSEEEAKRFGKIYWISEEGQKKLELAVVKDVDSLLHGSNDPTISRDKDNTAVADLETATADTFTVSAQDVVVTSDVKRAKVLRRAPHANYAMIEVPDIDKGKQVPCFFPRWLRDRMIGKFINVKWNTPKLCWEFTK